MKDFGVSACEKCGSADVRRKYHEAGHCAPGRDAKGCASRSNLAHIESVTEEHFICFCGLCRYTWQEKVKG